VAALTASIRINVSTIFLLRMSPGYDAVRYAAKMFGGSREVFSRVKRDFS
jgi:hypothetical protein